jgi:hypothetical protein
MRLKSFSHAVAVPALATFLFGSSPAGRDGLQLFHKMQTALGGAQKIASVHDYEQIVRAEAWHIDGRPMGVVRKRVRFVRPSYLRVDQVGREDTYALYFDGSSGWEILPDKTVANLAGGELRFAERYLTGLDLNSWLADRDPESVFTSPAPNVFVCAKKGDPSPPRRITLDPVTFLPVKSEWISLADSGHPVPNEQRFEQWRAVDGVKFPWRITSFQSGNRVAEITVEQIKLNSGLKPSDLAIKPPDLKPVMSR